MFVREVGNGPVVLVLHGSPSDPDQFLPLLDALAADHRVLLPYLPGYGASPPEANASYAHAGDQLACELRTRHVGELAAIIGYSSGSYRAFDLVLRREVRTRRIIGLGALAWTPPELAAVLREAVGALRTDPTLAGAMKAALPDRWLSPRWRAAHPEDGARVSAWFDAAPLATVLAELEAQVGVPDLRPQLRELAAEIHLRVGELDVACPPAWSHEIARLAQRATLEIVPGAGHALLIEDAPATVAWIASLLRT